MHSSLNKSKPTSTMVGYKGYWNKSIACTRFTISMSMSRRFAPKSFLNWYKLSGHNYIEEVFRLKRLNAVVLFITHIASICDFAEETFHDHLAQGQPFYALYSSVFSHLCTGLLSSLPLPARLAPLFPSPFKPLPSLILFCLAIFRRKLALAWRCVHYGSLLMERPHPLQPHLTLLF